MGNQCKHKENQCPLCKNTAWTRTCRAMHQRPAPRHFWAHKWGPNMCDQKCAPLILPAQTRNVCANVWAHLFGHIFGHIFGHTILETFESCCLLPACRLLPACLLPACPLTPSPPAALAPPPPPSQPPPTTRAPAQHVRRAVPRQRHLCMRKKNVRCTGHPRGPAPALTPASDLCRPRPKANRRHVEKHGRSRPPAC